MRGIKISEKNIFIRFLKSANAASLLLLLAVIISLTLANSPLNNSFARLLEKGILNFPSLHFSMNITALINDLLMAVFFLLVGTEIKREIIDGALSSVKNAALPIVAALGGMILPAAIFSLFNSGAATANGWGIPMATDIAFALAIISLLDKRIPRSLKVFLAALAIADDLGAILVIAIFYTQQIHFEYLAVAGTVVAILAIMNYMKVKNLVFYLLPGIILWYCIHHSGIHATIAGVLLAFLIPAGKNDDISPLEQLEHTLIKPVNLLIMPLFALANTNISINTSMFDGLLSPLGLGIIAGLLVGKVSGVTLFSFISVKMKFADLPEAASWKHIIGSGLLAGIGFTMSIFIALLSLPDPGAQQLAKLAILVTSVVAGATGYLFLRMQPPVHQPT